MKLTEVLKFAKKVNGLDDEQRRAFLLAFHNPTDATAVAAEHFDDDDDLELFFELLDTASAAGIDNADVVEGEVRKWMHGGFDPKCPTCGNRPGDGPGCNDPDGCGFGREEK